MGLMRLGLSNPAANTDVAIYTATGPFLASIIATNKSASVTSNVRMWIVPSGATLTSQYAYLAFDQDIVPQNTLETHRFALNQNDVVYVRADTADMSFMINGLKQVDIALAAGVTSYSNTAPVDVMDGMIWVDKDGNGTGLNTLAGQVIQSSSTTQVPLTLQGSTSQTANLFEVENSLGNVLSLIDNNGFLNIGKTSTASKPLEIYSASNPAIRIQNSSTGTSSNDGFLLEQSGLNTLLVNYEAGSIFFHTSNTNRMSVAPDGTVNINNNGSIYHSLWRSSLDRAWDNYPSITTANDTSAGPISEFRFHGYPGVSGGDYSIVVRSDGGYVTGSDSRRKTNIETIPNSLEIINSISGKSFNIINSEGTIQDDLSSEETGKRFGFIAQEVIEIIPEIVKYYPEADEENENGYASAYSIDYSSFVPVLVEAIKELSARIEFLETKSEGE